MPTKQVRYRGVRFDPESLQAALDSFTAEVVPLFRESAYGADMKRQHARKADSIYASAEDVPVPEDLVVTAEMTIETGDTTWTFDTREEYFAELRKPFAHAHFGMGTNLNLRVVNGENQAWMYYWQVEVEIDESGSTVTVAAGGRNRVERIMGIFDAASDRCTVVVPEAPAVRPRVFIGHGHSDQWKLLYQHLGDVHHFEVQAFESGSRAGHTIRDILEGLLESTDIALLVMTGEDAQPNTDLMRARQNVVHETGLFQGRLGFARGVILLEEGTEPFTNVDGIQYIPFAKGNIRETFGDVLGLLRREFGGL